MTTHSKHGLPVAENLLKRGDVQLHRPNQVWVSDITYIRSREGWLYLCIIMDLYSRSIVGWSMEERLTKELVLKSLNMACMRREPQRGIIFHSDRGSQYASKDFRALLAGKGFRASMSGKGNCYDNAHAESFFHVKIAICQRKKYLRFEINRDSKKLRFIERMLFYGFLGYTNGYNRHFMHEW